MNNYKSVTVKLCIATAVGVMLTSCNGGSSSSGGNPSAITYQQFSSYPGSGEGSLTTVTGIRGVDNSSNVYISGIYTDTAGKQHGMIYDGPVSSVGGSWNNLDYPSAPGATTANTAFYGPNNGDVPGTISVVGNYTTTESGTQAFGLLYQGPLDGVGGQWTTINPQILAGSSPIIDTIVHSNMGGFAVGNYDTQLATGNAFIYDINNKSYYEISKPRGTISITAYGIWHNGGNSYTIAGGYSNANAQGISNGYIVDWNSSTHVFSNWTTYNYKNQPLLSIISHFEGITTDGHGGYNLAADTGEISSLKNGTGAAFVHVTRIGAAGPLGVAQWTDLNYPNSILMSANTVYQNNVLGVYLTSNSISTEHSYVATVQQ